MKRLTARQWLWLAVCFVLAGGACIPGTVGAAEEGSPGLLFPALPIPDLPFTLPNPERIVEFPDPSMKAWVLNQLRLSGDTVRQSDIDAYCARFSEGVRLNVYNSVGMDKIRSVEGIQAFKNCNVISLQIISQPLEDVAPLAALTTLQTLTLHDNNIEDLRPLGALKELTVLEIAGNRVRSLSGLESLTKLSFLKLTDNEISDLSPLRNLSSLRTVELHKNKIENLDELSSLVGLQSLLIEDNLISDLTPIASLRNLRILSLGRNRIKDIDALQHLTNLFYVNLSGNWISSIAPLQNLPLTSAHLGNNRIDVTKVENLSVILQWISEGITYNVVGQDLNKEYPYDDGAGSEESSGPDAGAPDPEAPGTGGPGTSETGAPGAGGPDTSDSGTPGSTGPSVPLTNEGELVPIRGQHNFTDVAGHWAEEDIQWAYERGIVNGVREGMFLPDGTTTEEQFLKMLLISMRGLREEPVSTPWSQKYYDFAEVYGYPVHPEDRGRSITRRAVAELIAATQGERLVGDDAIQYLLDEGLSNGKTAPTVEGYKGDDFLTRAEAVRFIRNVLQNAKYKTPQPVVPGG